MSNATKRVGGCHCGAVRYEAEVDLSAGVNGCNCSICTKVAGVGMTLKPSAFRLLKGEESLSEYRVGQSPNSRLFCKHCGVGLFGKGDVPALGGKFVSIRVNTLDDVDPSLLQTVYWDGRHNNWQAGARKEPWPVRA